MAFLHTVPVEASNGPVREMYSRFQKQLGHVPNYAKAFSLRPDVMDAWGVLLKSIREHMSLRAYELATLAAARALRSSYCSLAHGSVLAEKVLDADSVVQIAEGAGPLEPKERALMAFATKVVESACDVTRSDVEELRSHGFRDEEIFDVAAAAAARCFFSKLLDAVGTDPDATYLEMSPSLRQVLTVGRPISSDPVERVEDEAAPPTGAQR